MGVCPISKVCTNGYDTPTPSLTEKAYDFLFIALHNYSSPVKYSRLNSYHPTNQTPIHQPDPRPTLKRDAGHNVTTLTTDNNPLTKVR